MTDFDIFTCFENILKNEEIEVQISREYSNIVLNFLLNISSIKPMYLINSIKTIIKIIFNVDSSHIFTIDPNVGIFVLYHSIRMGLLDYVKDETEHITKILLSSSESIRELNYAFSISNLTEELTYIDANRYCPYALSLQNFLKLDSLWIPVSLQMSFLNDIDMLEKLFYDDTNGFISVLMSDDLLLMGRSSVKFTDKASTSKDSNYTLAPENNIEKNPYYYLSRFYCDSLWRDFDGYVLEKRAIFEMLFLNFSNNFTDSLDKNRLISIFELLSTIDVSNFPLFKLTTNDLKLLAKSMKSNNFLYVIFCSILLSMYFDCLYCNSTFIFKAKHKTLNAKECFSYITEINSIVSLESISLEKMFYNVKNIIDNEVCIPSNFPSDIIISMESMFELSNVRSVEFPKSFPLTRLTSVKSMFMKCNQLEHVIFPENGLELAEITNMELLFSNSSKLKIVENMKFNTRKIVCLDRLFYCCTSLRKVDFSTFDFSNIVSMECAFSYCKNLEEIVLPPCGCFDTPNCTSYRYAFLECEKVKEFRFSERSFSGNVSKNMVFDRCDERAVPVFFDEYY